MSLRAGKSFQGPREPSQVRPEAFATLSAREEQVLSFASSGYLDKQIGLELGVSLNTLRTYWHRIREKIGDAPRSALAAAYIKYLTALAAQQPEIDQAVLAVTGAETLTEYLEETAEADWEIDLDRNTFTRTTTRYLVHPRVIGEAVPLEGVIQDVHPEDQPRIRALIASIRLGEIDEFSVAYRMITPSGVYVVSAFHRTAHDPVRGKILKGWVTQGATSPIAIVSAGHWNRDLVTDARTYDDDFLTIFRLDRAGGNLKKRVHDRFEPGDGDAIAKLLVDAVAAGRERVRAAGRLLFDDGTTLWIALIALIVYENGKPKMLEGTVYAF